MPLSQLQERLIQILRDVPGSESFVLVGGGALAVLGIGDRGTRDLDWFAETAEAVDSFAPVFERSCVAAGLLVDELVAETGFHRFQVADHVETTVVDLAWDMRLRQPQDTRYGLVLDRDELAADKMLALFGRAAPRDFVDVYRLRAFYSRADLSALAFEKDRGFDKSVLADMIAYLARYEREDFPVDDGTFEELRREYADWRDELSREQRLRPGGERALDTPEPPSIDLGL